MGFFSSFFGAFKKGWAETGSNKVGPSGMAYVVPHTRDLLYPDTLPRFDDIAQGGHADKRAIVYTILNFGTGDTRTFTEAELSALDFGKNRAAYTVLLNIGLAKELEPYEEVMELFTREDMINILRERGLSARGNKKELAERLIKSGYKIDRRKYRTRRFRLTEKGKGALAEHWTDKRAAIEAAIKALGERDYGKAISAYRTYDGKWGFEHSSGKKHTIFAHYDIPYSRFEFLARYQMRELNNSEHFKNAMRACLFAGLMRGTQNPWELRGDFESVCAERIDCPDILSLFDYDANVLEEMQRQIDYDIRNALEYYISHVLYLCRQWS